MTRQKDWNVYYSINSNNEKEQVQYSFNVDSDHWKQRFTLLYNRADTFETTLIFKCIIHSTSCAMVKWFDPISKIYYYSHSITLEEAILNNTLINGTISGTFGFRKQGQAVFLIKIK